MSESVRKNSPMLSSTLTHNLNLNLNPNRTMNPLRTPFAE